MRRWSRLALGTRRDRETLRRTTPVPELAYTLYDRVIGPLTVPLLGHPVRGRAAIRPFFITGSGRSGTTLVRRILTSHPELHVAPEARIALACRVYQRNRRLVWDDLVRVTVAAFVFSDEFEHYQMRPYSLVRALCRVPRRQRSLVTILDQIYTTHAAQFGKTPLAWGDKTPSNARFLRRLDRVFPECRVLHVLRDGVDVAHSSAEAGIQDSLLDAGRRWVNEAGRAAVWCERHPQRAITVRYEELVADPTLVGRRMCDFLGVDFLPAMLESADGVQDVAEHAHMAAVQQVPIHTRGVGRGRRALAGDARLVELGQVLDPTLVKLGYAPVVRGS